MWLRRPTNNVAQFGRARPRLRTRSMVQIHSLNIVSRRRVRLTYFIYKTYTLVTKSVDVRSEQVADIGNDRDREQYLISKILIVCSSQT